MDRILRWKALKFYVPYSRWHIARLERSGQFPQRVRIGPGCSGWLETEVQAWLSEKVERRSNPTNEKAVSPGKKR